MRKCIVFLIGLWSLSGEIRADCVSDLMSGQSTFMQCVTDLGSSMASLDPSDPHAMCKDPIKSHMSCIIGYIKQCPILTEGQGPFSSLSPAVDNYEHECKNMQGSGSCPAFTTCVQEVQKMSASPEMKPSGKTTPFSILPTVVFSVCRVFKHQLGCFNTHRAACPDEVKASEDLLSQSLIEDKRTNIDLDQVKLILREDCPKVPANFTSNTCVREKLEGSGFTKCMYSVKQLSAEASRDEHCKFYFDGKACVENYIGEPCGQQNAKVIIDMAHLVIHDLPQNCQMPGTPDGNTGVAPEGNHGDGSMATMDRNNGNTPKTNFVVATLLLCLVTAFVQKL